jgi:hypothetical protein
LYLLGLEERGALKETNIISDRSTPWRESSARAAFHHVLALPHSRRRQMKHF